MAGALFDRVKTWISTEDVEFDDLNAEFDNILNNLTSSKVDDFSINASQMQSTADPGEVGSESLATSVTGELQRLRFIIAEITGEDEWYESPVSSLSGLANALGSGLTNNRMASGRKRSDISAALSAQPIFLVPNGAARTVKLDGTPVDFVYFIEGVSYTISTDVTLTNLTAAPSSSNTALINDSATSDQEWTKHTGENGSEIPIDTAGTEITALIGKFAAFKLGGTTDEYLLAHVTSATSLTKARRGYFFDSTDAAIPRAGYSNNDTLTLMKLAWIFATTSGALTATYNNPVWSDDEPTSPSIGDYWFDTSADKWKKYDVSSFLDADAILVGCCIQDTSNTVGARSFEFFKAYDELNTVELFAESNTQVKSRFPGSKISVWGNTVINDHNLTTWDMTLDRDSGVSENSSTTYYFYITDTGDKVISDVRPFDRRMDLQGYYHPHQSWRCVGFAFNNGSSNLTSVESFYTKEPVLHSVSSQTAASNIEVSDQFIPLDSSGGAFTKTLPPAALCRGQTLVFMKTSSDFNIITLDGFLTETVNGSTTAKLATQYEAIDLFSTGSEWLIKNRRIPSKTTAWTPTGSWVSNTTYSGFWTRRGGSIDLNVKVLVSGVPTAVQLTVALATGWVIDTARMSLETASVHHSLGLYSILDFNSTGVYQGVVGMGTTARLDFWDIDAAGNYPKSDSVPQTEGRPQSWATGDMAIIHSLMLPLVDWEG